MNVKGFLLRLAMVALIALSCRSLTGSFGPIGAIAIWAGCVVGICGVTALALSRKQVGQVSFVNYLAGHVIPFGYRIGHGKLVPIFVVSSLVWVAIGVCAVLSIGAPSTAPAVPGSPPATGAPSEVGRVLLYLAWLVDGFVFLRVVSQFVERGRSAGSGTLRFVLGLGAVLVISFVLAAGTTSEVRLGLALAIAGGPPLIVGGGYGIFLAVVLLFGRKMRWN